MRLPSKPYKHLFFDLDKTLWDIHSNGKASLEEMFVKFNLKQQGITDLSKFIELYNKHNDYLWELYRQNKISKNSLRSTRFKYTLRDFGIKNTKLTRQLSEYFYYHTPRRGLLIQHAKETLEYLAPRYYLHIITNGFDDVQHIKMKHSGILHFFKNIITSNEAQSAKPETKIFEYALQKAGALKNESLMIGDDLEIDCLGALKAGIDQVFFNPKHHIHPHKFTFEIAELKQLQEIL